eukprot:Rhum_TRINITY_DN11062_c0_g1::Rhum_TRINITY_DN11062_c0_g1_i1::g.41969::m.41969
MRQPASSVVLLACCTLACAQTTRQWSGTVSTSWHHAMNWQPVGIPGPTDSVVIDAKSPDLPALVILSGTAPVSVRTISIGSRPTTRARLQLQGSLNVTEYAAVLNSGALQLDDAVNAALTTPRGIVSGALEHTAGKLSGRWTVTGLANFSGPGVKQFEGAEVKVESRAEIVASGPFMFHGTVSVTSLTGMEAGSAELEFSQGSASTNASFVAGEFEWASSSAEEL